MRSFHDRILGIPSDVKVPMQLIFSWFADAGAWPEHLCAGNAALDQEVVGPLRLLDHVETMLGLGRPDVAVVKRVAAYRRKIEAAGPNRFWSTSFAIDPWSTARELLQWRDELVEAGWTSGVGGERSRLADLGAVDLAGPLFISARRIGSASRSERWPVRLPSRASKSIWSTTVPSCRPDGGPC